MVSSGKSLIRSRKKKQHILTTMDLNSITSGSLQFCTIFIVVSVIFRGWQFHDLSMTYLMGSTTSQRSPTAPQGPADARPVIPRCSGLLCWACHPLAHAPSFWWPGCFFLFFRMPEILYSIYMYLYYVLLDMLIGILFLWFVFFFVFDSWEKICVSRMMAKKDRKRSKK